MSQKKFVLSHKIPAWYHLRFSVEDMAIFVDMHPICTDLIEAMKKHFIAQFEKDSWIFFTDNSDHWGFNGLGEKVESIIPKWTCLKFTLPQCFKHQDMKMFTLNLSTLFHGLMLPKGDFESTFCQLYEIIAYDQTDGIGRAEVAVNISINFFNWLHDSSADLPKSHKYELPEITKIMKEVYCRLHPDAKFEEKEFVASLYSNGSLMLKCPDNAYLGPRMNHNGDYNKSGYTLLSDKTDNFLQQLTLFIGIIKVGEEAFSHIVKNH